MPISLKTQKMLWGRAAGRCSMPNCRLDLYESETETDDPTVVGENCHIVGESDDGPRADPEMPEERRNSYSNLILLCRNHHKIVDAQTEKYTVPILTKIKEDHEAWVRDQLGLDQRRQADEEQYAGLIETWQGMAHLDRWLAWSSHILCHGQPRMYPNLDVSLRDLRRWLLNRVWPKRYPALERSFENFRRVLEDFHETFLSHAEAVGRDGVLLTQKFYKIQEWDEERYRALLREYEFHVSLVDDLMLELTRAANLICDEVRKAVLHGYRLQEGYLIVQSGPNLDFSFHEFVVQYTDGELERDFPYPGLDGFLQIREQRDRHFGRGRAP